MAVVQYFSLTGQVLSKPIDAASYVRAPIVGDLLFSPSRPGGPVERMQVVGAEHRAFHQGEVVVPALALFLAPYPGAGAAGVPDVPDSAKLGLPNGH